MELGSFWKPWYDKPMKAVEQLQKCTYQQASRKLMLTKMSSMKTFLKFQMCKLVKTVQDFVVQFCA